MHPRDRGRGNFLRDQLAGSDLGKPVGNRLDTAGQSGFDQRAQDIGIFGFLYDVQCRTHVARDLFDAAPHVVAAFGKIRSSTS